uniref:SFRICE_013523 n=1 Tax=Spodoptera frugiperda TaxID=7108 RepID=A0A2H1W7M3_SPOFR
MTPAAAIALLLIGGACAQVQYFGKEMGALSQLQHGVRGRVFAVDARTLYLKDFHYDGEGPAAYFYVGASGAPSAGVAGAVRLRDERGGAGPLRRYSGDSITLSLPDGKTLRDYRWFAVYCDEYAVNFGDVRIPADMEYPRPAKVAPLRGVHGVSSDPVVVVDAQTLLVPNFSYDGEAPDAKFWVGRGDKPSPQGIRIPDENGKEVPLRKYDKKTIVLTLPGELTVFDIGHFAVWCEAFTVNFGHVTLPRAALANVPPSLKMLGVSPQSKLNCEVLYDELAFEVRWAVAGDSIVLQLVAKLEDGEYMAFGVSGDNQKTQMVGGDPAVAWVDKRTLKGYAEDYYLDAKSQCAGVRGSCPDERLVDNTNSIRLLNAALVNGYSIVTYQRSLKAADELDRPVLTNGSQAIIWAIGPLNSRNEVSYHPHFTKGDKLIEFGRPPVWNCPMPEEDEAPAPQPTLPAQQPAQVIKANPIPPPKPVPKAVPWEIPAIQCYEPPDGVFYAQMGPTGGKQGYSAITGHVGWGISWYINGLLIPEINVVRGRKYTFVVEGGSNPDVPARYHPFYITNDPVGGYFHKTDKEKEGIEIYAGVRRTRTGELTPTGVGRLCNWTPDSSGPEADEFPSFGAYQRSLTLVCEEGNPGVVTWIPDKDTPNTVYYQCFTHRHLGWKINVLDECDARDADESRVVEHAVLPPAPPHSDLRGEESVQSDGGLTGEVYPETDKTPFKKRQEYSELPISKVQIKEVIQTVEKLESKMKDDMKANATRPQYQVHEDAQEHPFVAEQPYREDDEYFFEAGKMPENYFLPVNNQKPLTLQTVLRPTPQKPNRPPFRRPVPPEIKLRRPPYQKGNNNVGYPLSLPNHHGSFGPLKKLPAKFNQNRLQTNMNRPPPMPGVTQMKTMPPQHQNKPNHNVLGPKQNPGPPLFSKMPNGPVQAIVMGKPSPNNIQLPPPMPSQTLNLGQTDIIANQVVKSQIMLPPGSNDAIAQHSNVQPYLNKPGQIILGKPMDNPMPLDQQMIPTKQQGMRSPPTPAPVLYQSTSSIPSKRQEKPQQSHNEIQSSDFMGESPDRSTIPPAVNTGFRPDSIVVESGFKPIIREPLMAGEDRITDFEESVNRREDTDVDEDYGDAPQSIQSSNHQYPPSDKVTETFEPMFIPSPPDHLLPTSDRTKEVFPANHAKEDRPHPVYLKNITQLEDLFSKKNVEREVSTDLMMDSDRISPHYLPPDPKLPKEHSQKLSSSSDQTFTTYDGKTVSAATLTTLTSVSEGPKAPPKLFSAKLPANYEQLLKTPQFGPFKGEIPPPVAAHINKEAQESTTVNTANAKTTHLKLVNKDKHDDLHAQGSQKVGVTEKLPQFEEVFDQEYEEDDGEADEDRKLRERRDTKATQFEMGHIEEVQTNGHSMPKNQVDFENEKHAAAAAPTLRLYWMTHVLWLALALRRV